MGLTFDALRAANIMRLPEFKDKKGRLAHSKTDGSDWSPGEWICAVTGELGELANLIKKTRRGDLTIDEARAEIAKEIADVTIYLDILAYQFRINMGKAVMGKFNEVSERVGSSVRLAESAPYRYEP